MRTSKVRLLCLTVIRCLAAETAEPLELGPADWPEGCLGYAFNLVRPLQPGHRRTVLFSQFGTVRACMPPPPSGP